MSDAVAGRALPAVVTRDEWEAARAELRAEEMEVAARLKELAAKRKRLPMRVVDEPYLFDGPSGRVALAEMFEGRNQLVVYHFMFHPDWEAGCEGCSMLVDGLPHLAHLHARDVTLALVSRAPLEALLRYRERMCWEVPWYSSAGASFNLDLGATVGDSEHPGLSVFLRDGDEVYLAYRALEWTDQLEAVGRLLDVVPYGSQERGEDVPDGWPQGDPWVWMRRHDEYDTGVPAPSAQT